jgi:putative transposase
VHGELVAQGEVLQSQLAVVVRVPFISSPTRSMTRATSPDPPRGRFRDECLNEAWFVSLADACRSIEAWRQNYNTRRPHSALGNVTPEAFEQLGRSGAEPARV